MLITRTGSLGAVAVFDDTIDAIPGAYLIQYRLRETVDPRYAYYYLQSPIGQAALKQGGAGVGRPNLNAPTIDRIHIPLPPLAVQHRIVEEIDRVQSLADDLDHALSNSDRRVLALRRGILARAFAGKLVPQCPDDEPADVLLARIHAERERAQANGNGRTAERRRKARA